MYFYDKRRNFRQLLVHAERMEEGWSKEYREMDEENMLENVHGIYEKLADDPDKRENRSQYFHLWEELTGIIRRILREEWRNELTDGK